MINPEIVRASRVFMREDSPPESPCPVLLSVPSLFSQSKARSLEEAHEGVAIRYFLLEISDCAEECSTLLWITPRARVPFPGSTPPMSRGVWWRQCWVRVKDCLVVCETDACQSSPGPFGHEIQMMISFCLLPGVCEKPNPNKRTCESDQ